MSSLTKHSLQQGKYAIAQELGRGGFGITYKARNNALARDVVIKTVNDALHQEPQFLAHQRQFQDEARRLARCFHPNIVRVVDFFTEDDLPYIVMDYIPGQTLDKLVQPHRPLPEARALCYIRQVGEAVEAIHRAGLLHRDIKPQNLILHPETQQVILIDFGIAREFTPGITQAHTHIVSEGYAPIEQYLQQARRSPASDVYGLAATLYTLLTAQVPTAAVLRDRVPLPPPQEIQPAVSPEVSDAVMRGLAVEPQDRPQQVSDWLALLFLKASGVQPTLTNQTPTVVVAPQYRPTVPAGAAAATVPAPGISPETTANGSGPNRLRLYWWVPGAVALAVFMPLMLGYAQGRNSANPAAPVDTVETVEEPTLTESSQADPQTASPPEQAPAAPTDPPIEPTFEEAWTETNELPTAAEPISPEAVWEAVGADLLDELRTQAEQRIERAIELERQQTQQQREENRRLGRDTESKKRRSERNRE
jgi:eukaryotic-like serine/threonine-protein kinase